MKTIHALYMSWRYWLSPEGYNPTCLWLRDNAGKDARQRYEWFLDKKFRYDISYEESWNSDREIADHRDFKHMTPWQLRHARRKLIYQFFKERG